MSATGCQRGKLGKKESPSQESGEEEGVRSHRVRSQEKKKEEEGRRKKEEGRRKKEEGRRKKEEGRRKKKEISFSAFLASLILSTGIYSTFPCTSTSLPML
ncbi:hypothetical protein [Anabaena sp. 90]|uniref:hypothetical protein n=1 Tax=Anabaena sp. 90 TaxID=46234 RepID=UPI0013912E59|nr:hypothetical protein [Anabaena sp. 90]